MMEKLNELVEAAQRFHADNWACQIVKPEDILAIAAAFQALEQRAEAAEVEKAGAGERCRMMFEAKNYWADRARAAEAKLVPDGCKVVPVEPTAAMYEAGDQQLTTKQVWDAMLAAAPSPSNHL